jgi:O-antigen ligase
MRGPRAAARTVGSGGPRPFILLGGLALALLAATLWIDSGVYRGYTIPRYALVLAGAPLLLAVLLDLALAGRFPGIGLLFPGLLALELAGLLVPSLVVAPDRAQAFLGSFERLMGVLTYAALAVFALSARVAVEGSANRFRWLLGAIAISGAAALLRGPCYQEGDPWRWTGTFGHANYTSNVLLIPLFASLGLALGARRGWPRAAWLAAAAVSACMLALLQTRGAWAGGAAGAVVLAALLLAGPLRLRTPARRRLGLAAALLAVLAGTAMAVPLFRGRIVEKLRVAEGSSGRIQGWRDSGRFFRDHWLLGVGAESFRDTFLPYKTERLGQVLGDQQLSDLHSMPLHMLAEGGVAGLAAYLGLAALAAARLSRTMAERDLPRGDRWAAAGLLAALVAHFTHNLTISHVLPASLFWHVLVGTAAGAGAGWRRPLGPGPIPTAKKRAVAVVRSLSIAGCLALFATAWAHLSRIHAADAAILRCQRDSRIVKGDVAYLDIDLAIREGRRAVQLAPEVGPYHFLFARTLEGFLTGNAAEATRKRHGEVLPLAIEEAAEAERRGGNKESDPLELGYLYFIAGRQDQAEQALRRSLAADPYFWGSHRVLGRILLEEGRRAEARKELEAAERFAPDRPEVKALRALLEK